MDTTAHPIATPHLPGFITPPGQTDVLMVVMVAVLAFSVLGFGVLFFRLHSLPEQIAHKGQKLQAEVVAVLCLISLFTHMHIFWIIGLVLAMIELPDFGTPLKRIAGSAEKLAGLQPGEGDVEVPNPYRTHGHGHGHAEAEEAPQPDAAKQGHAPVPLAARAEASAPTQRERIHA